MTDTLRHDLTLLMAQWQLEADAARYRQHSPPAGMSPPVWMAYCAGRSDTLEEMILELARVIEDSTPEG